MKSYKKEYNDSRFMQYRVYGSVYFIAHAFHKCTLGYRTVNYDFRVLDLSHDFIMCRSNRQHINLYFTPDHIVISKLRQSRIRRQNIINWNCKNALELFNWFPRTLRNPTIVVVSCVFVMQISMNIWALDNFLLIFSISNTIIHT